MKYFICKFLTDRGTTFIKSCITETKEEAVKKFLNYVMKIDDISFNNLYEVAVEVKKEWFYENDFQNDYCLLK